MPVRSGIEVNSSKRNYLGNDGNYENMVETSAAPCGNTLDFVAPSLKVLCRAEIVFLREKTLHGVGCIAGKVSRSHYE